MAEQELEGPEKKNPDYLKVIQFVQSSIERKPKRRSFWKRRLAVDELLS